MKNKQVINNVFGVISYDNKLFNNINHNRNYNLKTPTKNDYYINNLLIYHNVNNIDILLNDIKMINNKGYVSQLQKWLIESNYNKNKFN